MKRGEHHVVHNSERGGWDVKQPGALRVSGHYGTKSQAVSAGRIMSRNKGTELVIHGENGRIQNSDSHGCDPCPPRDRK